MQELESLAFSLAKLRQLTARAEKLRHQDLPAMVASINHMEAFYPPEQEEAIAERVDALDVETDEVVQAIDDTRDKLRELIRAVRIKLNQRKGGL